MGADAADHAVGRDPGHHLGVGEVAAGPAHLPEAVVGLGRQMTLEVIEQRDLQVPGVVGGRQPASRARCSASRTSPHTSS